VRKKATYFCRSAKQKWHEPEDVLDASFFITAWRYVPITVMRGKEKLTFDVQGRFSPGGAKFFNRNFG